MRWTSIPVLVLLACGDDPMNGSIPGERIVVRFEHHASTETLPELVNTSCAQIVGKTHIHLSWRDYAVTPLFPINDNLWAATFHDVPIGSHKIRVSDPNWCHDNPTGAVTATVVTANGITLTNETLTPGDGREPGFAFSVGSDGTVVP